MTGIDRIFKKVTIFGSRKGLHKEKDITFSREERPHALASFQIFNVTYASILTKARI
jgi:hypothetical protein